MSRPVVGIIGNPHLINSVIVEVQPLSLGRGVQMNAPLLPVGRVLTVSWRWIHVHRGAKVCARYVATFLGHPVTSEAPVCRGVGPRIFIEQFFIVTVSESEREAV